MDRNEKKMIEYKWKTGTYELNDMIKLVKKGILNQAEFFYITRYNFQGVNNKQG